MTNLENYFNDKHFFKSCNKANVAYLGKDGADQVFLTPSGIKVLVNKYYWVFIEIFCENQYEEYKKYMSVPYILFDLGANRGYGSLLFAKDSNIERVYAFEPDHETYKFLRRNVDLNPDLAPKIRSFNYGLSNETKKQTFYSHPTADGIATSKIDFVDSYWKDRKKDLVVKEVDMKRASMTVADIVKRDGIQSPLVLKIDIEGGEYDVLREFRDSQFLQNFSMVFGECHLGMQEILDICTPVFKCVYLKESKRAGVCDFVLIKA